MSKDRLGAFMDAIIAIIMTILILELKKPAEPSLDALLKLWKNILVYALSFIWLGSMWVSIHNAWDRIEKISQKTIWLCIMLLFCSSFMPYTSSLVGSYVDSRVIEGFYGIVVILTTVFLTLIYYSLANDNDIPEVCTYLRKVTKLLCIDIVIKLVALVIGVLFYLPIVAIGIVIAAIFIAVGRKVHLYGII